MKREAAQYLITSSDMYEFTMSTKTRMIRLFAMCFRNAQTGLIEDEDVAAAHDITGKPIHDKREKREKRLLPTPRYICHSNSRCTYGADDIQGDGWL